MVNGNGVKVQFAAESSFGTSAAGDTQIEVLSESLAYNATKTEEGLLTGGIGGGKVETMSADASGTVSVLAKPITVGFFLKQAFGVEAVVSANTKYKHTFTPIGNGEGDYLPSITFNINRMASVLKYLGMTANSLSFSASAGDRLKLDIGYVGKTEDSGSMTSSLSDLDSAVFAFKLSQLAVSIGDTAIDCESITFNYNNNCDNSVQTTGTGLYHAQPKPGKRECTAEISALFDSTTEGIRTDKFKTDAIVSLTATFTDGSGNILAFSLPSAQIESMPNATATGADTMKQSMTIRAINNSTAFCKVELTNGRSAEYPPVDSE